MKIFSHHYCIFVPTKENYFTVVTSFYKNEQKLQNKKLNSHRWKSKCTFTFIFKAAYYVCRRHSCSVIGKAVVELQHVLRGLYTRGPWLHRGAGTCQVEGT